MKKLVNSLPKPTLPNSKILPVDFLNHVSGGANDNNMTWPPLKPKP